NEIALCARIGGNNTFEVCVMNADGSGFHRLTNNSVPDLTPSWSPDGTQIAFHRPVSGFQQMFIMNSDGTNAHPVTSGPAFNNLAQWGEVRTHVNNPGNTLALGNGEGLVGTRSAVDVGSYLLA